MLLLGLTLPLASAAVVTEIPTFLRGDIEISYAYEHLGGSLIERKNGEKLEVGDRTLADHRLQYGLVFSVAPGAAVFVQLPHYLSSQVSYGALSDMVYDPGTGSGTYEGTAEGTPGAYVSGSGLGGVWFGVRGTPFSESFKTRNSRATWLLEGAIRTADSTNVWTANDEGDRGAGPAGTAARLHTAFSTTFGETSPYITGTYIGEGAQTVQVVNPDGTDGAEVEVDGANHGDIKVGVELVAARNEASGSLFVFDLHLGVAYHSHGIVPSGFYLPNVLDASAGDAVLQAEQLEGGAGLGVHWRPFTNMQIGLFGDVGYHMPQRLEYPYPVYTGGDTIRVTAGSSLLVRFR